MHIRCVPILVVLAIGVPTGTTATEASNPAADGSRRFQTSFESTDDFAGFYIVPQNNMGSASHDLSDERVHSGTRAHKAWMYGVNRVVPGTNTNHRAYPTVQLYRRPGGAYGGRVRIDLWVWLDVTLEKGKADKNWLSLATLTSYADDHWYRVLLVNLHEDGYLHFMHAVDHGKSGDLYQAHDLPFPQKRWVELTIELDYSANNEHRSPLATLWQDGVLVSMTRFNPRVDPLKLDRSLWPPCLARWDRRSVEAAERLCGLKFTDGLAQAHFGLYAPPRLKRGIVYNDDLSIAEVR